METLIILTFVVGYLAITLEHPLQINKAASAILTGVLCWTIFVVLSGDSQHISDELTHHLGDISGILFFLLGAMTIVELIDMHDGFDVITRLIGFSSRKKLLWIISILTFFLSAILDNLTTSIVMITLLRKIIPKKEDRLLFSGMVIISANSGGAWSPIGDVTTTMLWIGGQITTMNIVTAIIVPSIVSMVIPLVIITLKMKGGVVNPVSLKNLKGEKTTPLERNIVFYVGIGALLFVPIYKTITGLPPFMGIFFGLGVLWLLTELIHKRKNDEIKSGYSVAGALQRIDVPSVLFFFGILVAISSLEATGTLKRIAEYMSEHVGNLDAVVFIIGIASSVVDNVPLVAAAKSMYSLADFPQDNRLWEFLAYCAGTGGSILIIGSASGVAVMGMEKIDFIWYLKKISLLALIGYLSGAVTYLIMM